MEHISITAARGGSPVGLAIDSDRLGARLDQLGRVGLDERGGRTRLALSAADKEGRDLIVGWLRQAGATIRVDRIGNIFGIVPGTIEAAPIMTGSHIDTVACAGALDGCYGVVAGIELLQTLRDHGLKPKRPIVVAAFTNEEGVRFVPDLLGSRVIAREIALDAALACMARDGAILGEELKRIGYAGDASPWELIPSAFIELHIEQGPVLDAEGVGIGIVEGVQGHSWWRVVIEGTANHAGTTPMYLRRDAGAAAMKFALRILDRSTTAQVPAVATVGALKLEPGSINVVPGRAELTLDLRDPRDELLRAADLFLSGALTELNADGWRASAEQLSKYAAVVFDQRICTLVEERAKALSLSTKRMTSGASHDAQMMARICPTAMIFVPSLEGISHNPREFTAPAALHDGANVLLHAVLRLADE